ncbi:uncharacterized protein At2g24330-like isoform X2 [Lotus japonicus]|uniref:uncharacterized protein At2g24330-like isoform X2 n=1 Tax=Lotus japonicus TaxID=34305 RepID=UPI0025832DF9|nr:uncharacterized protein At2g24330-like isoform X2 [Lotus japonicus]
MGEEKETSAAAATNTDTTKKKQRKGLISRIWNVIFRSNGNDLEKRLQHLSKAEASVMNKIANRSRFRSRILRNLILFSVLFQVIAVVYATMTTRSVGMNWKMRAIRVLPMFLLPALSSAAYSFFVSFIRMCDRRDQKTLETLRAERQAKIDELKEKTNYYITQQLIQRYDTDPAAKAAAATVLASKLGADSGLKVHVRDESMSSAPTGTTNDAEHVQSSGLRSRKQVHSRSTSPGTTAPNYSDQQLVGSGGVNLSHTVQNELVVVGHHKPQSSTHNGGWIARIAALLVGLARKEEFPFITYYCPHCHALNKPKQSGEQISGFNSPKADNGEADRNPSACAADKLMRSNNPVNTSPETEKNL